MINIRPAQANASPSVISTALLAAIMFAIVAGAGGCHRQYYRRQADMEVNYLMAEKAAQLARPPEEPLTIEVDRRSRMFNPFDLDFQPMPLDDPASHRYMQCVDGRRGYPMWEAAGLTNTAESPDWWQFLPLDEDGVLVLNAENAVRIALLHSPDYQQQVENLYLSALNVSAERFVFDTRFYGGAQASLATFGAGRNANLNPGSPNRSSTQFAFGPFSSGRRPLSMERRFATGADLVVGVANNVVWELSGPNARSASTVLDFTLVQPLLRNAGRDVVLEQLTLAERNLLANIRAFERYRRSFFLNITIGRGVESTPGVGEPMIGINGSGFGTGGGGAGGFIGLLQNQLQIRNSEENIARQTENLLILEDTLIEMLTTIPESPETIIRQRLQVAQARQRLLNSQSGLVSNQANFQRSVDSFVRSLGLPPYLCVRIEDDILERFELIDRQLLSRRAELGVVRTNVGEINVDILERATYGLDEDTGLPELELDYTPELAQLLSQLRAELEPLAQFSRALLEEDLPTIMQDIEEFEDSLAQRQVQNDNLYELYQNEQQQICSLLNLSEVDESIFEIDELSELGSELLSEHQKVKARLETYQERLAIIQETLQRYEIEGVQEADPVQIATRIRSEIILASQDLLSELGDDVLTLQLIQARARTESVLLPEVTLDPETAVEIARLHRRDWANARAALVDNYRLIEFTADDLESSLDVTFSGDIRNEGNNPFALRGDQSSFRVGLQWDAPITRLLERNTYRSALIDYERAKRSYYTFEDAVWQQLRAEIRQLQANRINFELGRQAVRIAAAQIGLTTDIQLLNYVRGQSSGPTAARDAIDALDALLDAQNGLLNIFVNYEVVRRSLDFDLGTMQLTPDGLWLDPGEIDASIARGVRSTAQGGMIAECNCDIHGHATCNCGLPLTMQPIEAIYGTGLDESELEGGTGLATGLGIGCGPDCLPLPPPLPGEEGGLLDEDVSLDEDGPLDDEPDSSDPAADLLDETGRDSNDDFYGDPEMKLEEVEVPDAVPEPAAPRN